MRLLPLFLFLGDGVGAAGVVGGRVVVGVVGRTGEVGGRVDPGSEKSSSVGSGSCWGVTMACGREVGVMCISIAPIIGYL